MDATEWSETNVRIFCNEGRDAEIDSHKLKPAGFLYVPTDGRKPLTSPRSRFQWLAAVTDASRGCL